MPTETDSHEFIVPETRLDATADSRRSRIERVLAQLETERGRAGSGRYRALTALLTDAMLASDEAALLAAQDGLQRVHGVQFENEAPTPEEYEQRGRVVTALDGVTWTLRRLTPSSVVARLEPGSHAHRFLEVVDAHPGLMSGTIEDMLNLRSDVVSRVGRRLRDEELVHQRRAGRHKHWDITPRGRQVLAAVLRAKTPADDAPPRRGESAGSA